MGFLKNFSISLALFWVMVVLGLFPVAVMGADYTNLVFKGCANQKFPDPSDVYAQNLNTLLSFLVSQSSEKTFLTTTSGQDQSAITGVYQCRGDLTTDQCSTCISKIPKMIDKLCGKSMAARLQLNGCYLQYEVAGFKQVADSDFLFKVCGSSQDTGSEFENQRDTAFSMTEDGVKNGNGLFYTGDYQSLYVLGQCEEDLGANNCGDCLKTAFQRVKEECADSISGQVYLQKCYISYSYYPNGIPNITSSSSPEAETVIPYHQGIMRGRRLRPDPPSYGQSPPSPMNPAPHYESRRELTQKTVVIAVGGVAIAVGAAAFMFAVV